ncbi:hypothetical protein PHYPO_G00065320 [Pangasianodon hypophthalmus]|uniref:Uncharacterized protein n=1 Tax=Pangasianodon hypophthalmus TaxID=310915 RepID=A0A5N5M241_PANHP|nr:hypothetical protein PHYPO_G00065320 [Pangasianodon hypophthalmus]
MSRNCNCNNVFVVSEYFFPIRFWKRLRSGRISSLAQKRFTEWLGPTHTSSSLLHDIRRRTGSKNTKANSHAHTHPTSWQHNCMPEDDPQSYLELFLLSNSSVCSNSALPEHQRLREPELHLSGPPVSEGVLVSYTLRITDIQKNDAGFYSCLLSSQNSAQDPKDLMLEGYSIRPGERIPTLAPTTVKKPKRVNRLPDICKSNNQSPRGCKSVVLWSGIGAVLLLVVVLISTLNYFSRLPKKCRHRYARKQQLK